MDYKNEDSSKSVSSFDFGAIFRPRLGQKLSRNGVVASVYAFEKNPYWRIGPGMTPKNVRIFENSSAGAIFLLLGGPAGGSALERASPPGSKHTT